MVLASLCLESGEGCPSSQRGRGKGERMGALAVRVDALLNEARDWPLAGAVDYLIENGLTIVDGWHPLKRGRMEGLHRRFGKLFKRVGITSLHHWYLCRARGEASVVWWKLGSPAYNSWAWEIRSRTPYLSWSVERGERVATAHILPEIVLLWSDEYAEDWLCDVAILLWCADRCYRRR